MCLESVFPKLSSLLHILAFSRIPAKLKLLLQAFSLCIHLQVSPDDLAGGFDVPLVSPYPGEVENGVEFLKK